MNRSLSVRSKQTQSSGAAGKHAKHRFTLASLRGQTQPEMSKKLYKLIKAEREMIAAYETAGHERSAIASQLSDWGEETGDDAVSDLSDKLGVLLSEIAEQEDNYAHNLEDGRTVLKTIRNTEKSVAPSRDHKAKVADEIQKLKYKEPQSPKVAELEQELVRAEAQSLVAEAQLTNITRQKFKEAYDIHLASTIERAEKQILLAKHARRILMLLDDTPIVPGDAHPTFERSDEARDILNVAEEDLREWTPTYEPISSNAGALASNAMPGTGHGNYTTAESATGYTTTSAEGSVVQDYEAPVTHVPVAATENPSSSMETGGTQTGQYVAGNTTGTATHDGLYTTA